MTGPVRLLLALLPLVGYFLLLGTWHSGRRAKVVPGPLDTGLLGIGLSGLIAFGPVGSIIVERIFPRPSLAAWLAVASLVGLIVLYAIAHSRRRMVVYHVNVEILNRALEQAMTTLAGPVQKTLQGFEDPIDGRGVNVEFGRWLGYAVIEAHGANAESLADALVPVLSSKLLGQDSPTTRLAMLWYGLACGMAAFLALSVAIMTRPEARTLIRRISGG